MKLQFQKKEVPCLRKQLDEVQTMEQTQEIRIPEGMPGIQRILGTWGQVVLRSKEWQGDMIRLSGGVLVWTLYEPEEGGCPQTLDAWIPFRMDWDLPAGIPEGTIRLKPLLRYVDARSVSAGKVMIRAGLGVLAECWCSCIGEISLPKDDTADVEMLRSKWPVRLPREAGEKTFEMEEELAVPASAAVPSKIVYFRMEPSVTDKKVLGNRLVFRGMCSLHVLYLTQEGQLSGWDFELPFSQYTDLRETYSQDAQADLMMAVTRLEVELDADGKLHLKTALTGQYLLDDRELIETVEDAYSPFRDLELERQMLELPAVLESRRENVTAEHNIPAEADVLADAAVLWDFPAQHRTAEAVELRQPGMVQILYYDREGRIQSANHRWEGNLRVPMDRNTVLSAIPMASQSQLSLGADTISVRTEAPVQLQSMAGQGIPMVTAMEMGEKKEPDRNRPSLILQKSERRLWDLARASGSTVAAIREANGITGEPEPGKMLLIPVV